MGVIESVHGVNINGEDAENASTMVFDFVYFLDFINLQKFCPQKFVAGNFWFKKSANFVRKSIYGQFTVSRIIRENGSVEIFADISKYFADKFCGSFLHICGFLLNF